MGSRGDQIVGANNLLWIQKLKIPLDIQLPGRLNLSESHLLFLSDIISGYKLHRWVVIRVAYVTWHASILKTTSWPWMCNNQSLGKHAFHTQCLRASHWSFCPYIESPEYLVISYQHQDFFFIIIFSLSTLSMHFSIPLQRRKKLDIPWTSFSCSGIYLLSTATEHPHISAMFDWDEGYSYQVEVYILSSKTIVECNLPINLGLYLTLVINKNFI